MCMHLCRCLEVPVPGAEDLTTHSSLYTSASGVAKLLANIADGDQDLGGCCFQVDRDRLDRALMIGIRIWGILYHIQ